MAVDEERSSGRNGACEPSVSVSRLETRVNYLLG